MAILFLFIPVSNIVGFGSIKNEYLYIFSFQITYLKSWQWMCMMRLTEEKMMSVSNTGNTRLVLPVDQLFNFKNLKNGFVSAVFLLHTYRQLVSLNRLVTNTWQQGFSQWSTGGAFSSPQPRFFSHAQSGMKIFSSVSLSLSHCNSLIYDGKGIFTLLQIYFTCALLIL